MKTFSDEFPAKSNHISLCKFMEQLPLFSESVSGRFANTVLAY